MQSRMNLLKYIFFLTIFSSAILSGCQGAPQTHSSIATENRESNSTPKISQVESSIHLDDRELNSAIGIYIDKYLSEIIRIRNFNRERVSKVVCIHHTGYVESAEKAPNSLRVYVKLLCVEAIEPKGGMALPISNGASIGNPMSVTSRIDVDRQIKPSGDKKTQESFYVVSDDTTRDRTYYLEDLPRILSNDLMDRMQKIKIDDKVDYRLLQKKADE
jgi:hypothetical protein